MIDTERSTLMQAQERVVEAFRRYDTSPGAQALDELRLAVGRLKLVHLALLQDQARSLRHVPDLPAAETWYAKRDLVG